MADGGPGGGGIMQCSMAGATHERPGQSLVLPAVGRDTAGCARPCQPRAIANVTHATLCVLHPDSTSLSCNTLKPKLRMKATSDARTLRTGPTDMLTHLISHHTSPSEFGV